MLKRVKVSRTSESKRASIGLASELRSISEELHNLEKESTMSTAEKPKKRKLTKSAAKPAEKPQKQEGVSLQDLAKELKVSPASLRRRIRNMDGLSEQEGFRYHWPKSSPDLKKIRAAVAD